MVLGPCFWVFWIGVLSLAEKGFGYPQMINPKTLKGGDKIPTPATSDIEKWLLSYREATNPGSTRFSRPPNAYQLGSVPNYPDLPFTPNVHQAERVVHDGSREWSQENDNPLAFPLSPNYQLEKRAEARQRLGRPPPKHHDVSPSNYGVPYPNLPTYYRSPLPVKSWGAPIPHSSKYWQRNPVDDQVPSGFGSYNPDLHMPSTVGGNLISSHHPVYEDVSRPPPERTDSMSEPRYAIGTAEKYDQADKPGYGPTSGYPTLLEKPSFSHYSAALAAPPTLAEMESPDSHGSDLTSKQDAEQTGHRLPDKRIPSWVQQEPAFSTQHTEILHGEGELVSQPPSYVVQSRNSYRRGRVLFTKTSYSPEQPVYNVKKPKPNYI